MNSLRLKRPRLALHQQAYRELHEEVLKRDGWRCQCCGAMHDLQVHHMQSRSLLGDDAEENLITLAWLIHQGTES